MSDDQPRSSEHHDLLVITRASELHRVPVEKTGEQAGRYVQPPERRELEAPGVRKVFGIADPTVGAPEPGTQRGPALSTLPVHTDPAASSYITCYLLNLKNLTYRNPWTVEEWNDAPPDEDQAAVATPSEFELVVGAPDGSAHLIRRRADGEFGAKPLDLARESEVWNQLRNGCVAGSVRVEEAGGRIVPLVNVASLMPPKL